MEMMDSYVNRVSFLKKYKLNNLFVNYNFICISVPTYIEVSGPRKIKGWGFIKKIKLQIFEILKSCPTFFFYFFRQFFFCFGKNPKYFFSRRKGYLYNYNHYIIMKLHFVFFAPVK